MSACAPLGEVLEIFAGGFDPTDQARVSQHAEVMLLYLTTDVNGVACWRCGGLCDLGKSDASVENTILSVG
jgi:hypothetical protein